MKYKIKLGQLVITPGAMEAIGAENLDELRNTIYDRHACGDWGEICDEDKRYNDAALIDGYRILSAYTIGGTRIWIITEADRSATTVLLPEEY